VTDHREKLEAKLARLADRASVIAGWLDKAYRIQARNDAASGENLSIAAIIDASKPKIQQAIDEGEDIFECLRLQREYRRLAERARSFDEKIRSQDEELQILIERMDGALEANREERRRLNHKLELSVRQLEALTRQGVLPL
jgi:hypothetical protein